MYILILIYTIIHNDSLSIKKITKGRWNIDITTIFDDQSISILGDDAQNE